VLYYLQKEKRKELKKMENFDKRMLKKSPEELQAYLAFRRRAGKVPAKKGKGSYDRKAFKKEVA
jgi:stalled ribosome alternative rescue factor ArfA